MFSTSDTIVAIATPPGRGGIGVVRISGPDAERIARELTGRPEPFIPRHATLSVCLGVRSRKSPCGGDDQGQEIEGVNQGQGIDGVRSRKSPSGGDDQGQVDSPTLRDQVVVTYFQAPASYTGEDVVEISAHGSPVVLGGIVRAAVEAGARLAQPGEFTLRAFLNNKIDLIQAEAVADLVDAVTPLQARAAFDQLEGTLTGHIGSIERDLFDVMAKLEASLDFPDEGYHFVAPREARASLALLIDRIDALLAQAARGRLVREGAQVAIVGAPNVGKSSLFNALLNTDRAIVTAVPGTTRDLLTERADVGGLSLALIDTAGVRETADVVEREGVSRARDTLRVADLVIVMLDRSRPMSDEDRELLAATASQPRVVVWNKCDLPPAQPNELLELLEPLELSVAERSGIDRLIEAIASTLSKAEPLRDQPEVTNVRHTLLLERAHAALSRAATALEGEVPEEFPLIDLQEAGHALQEITGRRTTDDLLRHIFERFCIGK